MSYVPDSKQLRGLSYPTASLFGMPHLGAHYYRDDIRATRLDDDTFCARCGRPATNAHHEPPRSKGSFLLMTDWGRFVLKPALIALCGSGTTGCHGMRHSGLLRVRWEWDTDESAEKWWSGHLLSHGYRPHSPGLFNLGRYVFEDNGCEWEVRR